VPSVSEEVPVDLRTEVLRLLDEICDPCSVAAGLRMGLVEMGLVESVEISGSGEVEINLRLTSPFCEMIGFFKGEAVDKISVLPHVTSVYVRTDSGLDWSPDMMSTVARQRRHERLRRLSQRARAARRETGAANHVRRPYAVPDPLR
jgi:metal-sulfur cluster biosynthetic enzyme